MTIRQYNAPPASERWSRITKQNLIDLIAEFREGASNTTSDIAIASYNEGIEEAEETLAEVENGSKAWMAQDEDGYYFALCDRWVSEGDLNIDFAELKEEACAELEVEPETDDATDDAINAALDAAGLRKQFSDGIKFDCLANRNENYVAIRAGVKAWDDHAVDVASVEHYDQLENEQDRIEYRENTSGLSAGTKRELDRIDAGLKAKCLG